MKEQVQNVMPWQSTRWMRWSAVLVMGATGAFSLSGCGDCAGVGRPAFEVTVRDARTGAALSDSVVITVLRHPDRVPVFTVNRPMSQGRYWVADDQTGMFDVVVERPGYYPWTTNNRTVKGDCTVETVYVTASMVPRSG